MTGRSRRKKSSKPSRQSKYQTTNNSDINDVKKSIKHSFHTKQRSQKRKLPRNKSRKTIYDKQIINYKKNIQSINQIIEKSRPRIPAGRGRQHAKILKSIKDNLTKAIKLAKLQNQINNEISEKIANLLANQNINDLTESLRKSLKKLTV